MIAGPYKYLQKFLRIEPEETQTVLWSFFYFFFLLSSYYILQPIRDEMGLLIGREYLPSLFRWSLVVMIIMSPIFSYIVSKLPRKKFIPLVYHFFLLNLVMFFVGFKFYSHLIQKELAISYFLWVSVFNLFAVSIFWGFMADIFSSNQGKRLFGFIGAGGTLGQIFGSSFTAYIVYFIGNTNLLIVSAIFLELSVICMLQVSKNLHINFEQKVQNKIKDGGAWEGISSVLNSKYLLGVCFFMFLYTFTSTFLYFEKQAIVAENILTRAGRTSFFSSINLAVGILTVLIQLFFTGRVIPMIGLALSLASLPLFTGLGFFALGLLPQLWVIAGVDVLRKTINYAITRPSREILYTVVSRSEKYKAKSFIDTFVYRGGDAIASIAFEAIQSLLKLGLTGMAFSAIPVAFIWILNALSLGKTQQAKEKAKNNT